MPFRSSSPSRAALPPVPDPILLGRNLLAGARRIVVLTGAGVSRESGVPTFRGAEGLWRSFRPEELATPQAFARDPGLVWSWYAWRRKRVAPCRPNAAHHAIARLIATRDGVTLVTQNVDGLHELAAHEAGAGGGSILALHGSLFATRCTRCDYHRVEPRDAPGSGDPSHDAGSGAAAAPRAADAGAADAGAADTGAAAPALSDPALTDDAPLPSCPRCGALLRPDVVWFGESLDPGVLEAAWQAAEAADVCLVVGTSGVVQPAASLATVTRRGGGTVIEVNPEPTPITSLATVSIRASAATAVPALLAAAGAPPPIPPAPEPPDVP